MRLYNKSKRTYQHGEYKLLPGQNIEVKDNAIAKILLKTGEIVEYVSPKEAKAKEEAAAQKQAELEGENAKLKAELEKLKKAAEKKTDNKKADK